MDVPKDLAVERKTKSADKVALYLSPTHASG